MDLDDLLVPGRCRLAPILNEAEYDDVECQSRRQAFEEAKRRMTELMNYAHLVSIVPMIDMDSVASAD